MRTSGLALVTLLVLPTAMLTQAPLRSTPEAERANIHYRLGWEALRSEAFADAVKEFQHAIDIDRKFKLAYYGLGRSYMGLRQFQDAVKVYETCRGLYEGQASERFKNSLDADKLRQDDQREYQIAIDQLERGPQTQQVQLQIQQLRNAQQRIQVRRDQTRNLSLDSAPPAFVSVALGSAYFRAERLADAERAYKAAVDVDSTIGEAHNNLAVVYMLTGRFDESTREVALAEKAGFRVNPEFKKDLAQRRQRRP